MVDKDKIEELRRYFDRRQDILFAYLFGSQVKGIPGKISDWDIAVYFKPDKELEFESTEKNYPKEDEIWNDLVEILETENVDLVILNRSPSNISATAISEGIPLIMKDSGLFLDFMLLVMRQAEDYRGFVEEYYRISQHSTSLGPKEKERLRKIVLFLEKEFSFYDYFSKFEFKDYEDGHKRRDIERWIENLVNSAIDIGQIILASEKRKIPDYYKDVFIQLGLLAQFKGIDIEKFGEWIKLRNILAHEYLDIKWNKIKKFISECRANFESFLKRVKDILE